MLRFNIFIIGIPPIWFGRGERHYSKSRVREKYE
jgi:hypothetical protein